MEGLEMEDEVKNAIEAYRHTDWDSSDPPPAGGFVDQALSLGRRGFDAVDDILKYLESSSRDDRAAAVFLLGRVGEAHRKELGPGITSTLLSHARKELDDEVLHAIAVAVSLAGIESDNALELLNDRDYRLRRVGAYDLAMTVSNSENDEAIRTALRGRLSDPDDTVRRWVRFGIETLP